MKIIEVLNNVKKAELEATTIVANAQQGAAEILKNANKLSDIAYKETFENAVKKHREDINQKIEEEKLEAEKETKTILLDINNEIIEIQQVSSKNIRTAVKTLLDEITK